jgi:glycosyltransferase involved in cell wall biosynthesis
MPLEPLEELARKVPGTVRFVPRFITDEEIPAYFRRADAVALPYRQIDQSGVLYTALAFGKPLVLSSVGGFTEIAERHGAVKLVPPGDAQALAAALNQVVADPPADDRATAPADSWDSIAAQHLALYRELVAP